MRYFRFLLPFLLGIFLVAALNHSYIISYHNLGLVPAFGKLLSPFQGFWQNARNGYEKPASNSYLDGLKGPVSVYTDEYQVPHIVASNNEDLYYMQGYITARDRLWEMEFFTYAAAGRVSELVGEKGLDFDRTQRRLGLPYAAEQAVKLIDTDPIAKMELEAFAAGVNTYVKSLEYKDLPVEYKILDYRPETWTPLKTALLLKFMAKMLTNRDEDFEYTNALNLFGRATFDRLYPDFAGDNPIIPAGTPFNFTPVKIDTPSFLIPKGVVSYSPFEKPSDNIGSNNWAVSGKKTASGSPILCSDPHLGLNLPSIWYEIQLTSPDVNTYGVSIPGSPGVTIGFNDSIAWGVTNAERDVKDWYRIEYTDSTRDHYLFDGQARNTVKRIEEIKIKGRPTYYDTVIYTHIGPVTYDSHFKHYETPYPVALRWTALDTSDEAKTFYLLNRAKNHDDYMTALNYYACPGQNFAFACTNGDIAIRQQGRFVAKWREQGKFIQDGTTSAQQWQAFIPYDQNPHIMNPERGFVSSANQHPTDSTYPYYYNGLFEYNRNCRINEVLAADSNITVEDMMHLQNDTKNLTADSIVPYMIDILSKDSLTTEESQALEELKKWNYFDDPQLLAPAIFQATWNELYALIWHDFLPQNKKHLLAPDAYVTVKFLKEYPNDTLMDNRSTPERETASILVKQAFSKAIVELDKWKKEHPGKELAWGKYKATKITHWAKVLTPFDVDDVDCGGWSHIVNATDETNGPSWRMIVSLVKGKVEAWAIYPGGQSGNPGSPYYSDRVHEWATGKYRKVHFLKTGEAPGTTFTIESFQKGR